MRLLFGNELSFEFLHRAASFSRVPTDLAGSLGELVGTENHQEQKSDYYHLLYTNPEHRSRASIRVVVTSADLSVGLSEEDGGPA